ncbi:hypothetical protein DRP04_10160 [Archaeoglobales archaeon]|nr:MAG: hypothetical protein DRP04_10160 [Archaeoglobales archaeon]
MVFAAYAEFILVRKELVSSAVGLILPSHDSFAVTILSAFLLSVIIEFFVYAAFLGIPKLGLLKLSFFYKFCFLHGFEPLCAFKIWDLKSKLSQKPRLKRANFTAISPELSFSISVDSRNLVKEEGEH